MGAIPLALSACSPKDTPKTGAVAEVGIVTLQEQDTALTTSLPGRVVAFETSEVRPQVNGVIRRRLFEEGALVHAGQVLYEIEDAPYRAALAGAKGNLSTAQATIRSTQLQAERYRRLIAIKGVSQQDVDNAEASAAEARAVVDARKADVMAAEVNLDFTRVRAPITGRIGRSLVTVGGLAQTGQTQPLAMISNIGDVYVDVTEPAGKLLDLRDAIRQGGLSRDIPTAAKVQLILPNGKMYPAEGTLAFTDTTVDNNSGSVTIRARFTNPDGVLLPGMYVRAQLVQGVRHHAILAPQQGVTHDARGDAVALVLGADGKVAQRRLTLGPPVGDRWLVETGLKAGDRLIVEGQMTVKPGDAATGAPPQQIAAGDTGRPDAAGKD
ncbi:MAG: efflux RND transporter periplasmic adaptor subunit [Azospirillaceae bacterium]|nr:efflux RND transporter periplasmic adaptor subunit [Azospirillaceae bacterium]